MRYEFVKSILQRLQRDGSLSPRDTVLAVAAAEEERALFSELGLRKVTISNLDDRTTAEDFAPFAWSRQDAQQLSFEDGSFDFAFVSDGLHHCDSPHRALLEMYRVARRGVIVFESRDSLLMRLANWLGLSPNYELEAVVGHGCQRGGVNNTGIPNYIYRWTEREFEKAIRAHDPLGRHTFRFFHGLNLPYEQAEMKNSRLKYMAIRASEPFLKLGTLILRKQCNSFCMLALKPRPDDLWPWLERQNGETRLRSEYARRVFRTPDQRSG